MHPAGQELFSTCCIHVKKNKSVLCQWSESLSRKGKHFKLVSDRLRLRVSDSETTRSFGEVHVIVQKWIKPQSSESEHRAASKLV